VIITDNISTRTGEAARLWLAQHPRVRFVFTPKHGSWLNQVEIWFRDPDKSHASPPLLQRRGLTHERHLSLCPLLE
jgi:transposase